MAKDKVLYIRCGDELHEGVQEEVTRRAKASPTRDELSLSEMARVLLAERLAQIRGARKVAGDMMRALAPSTPGPRRARKKGGRR
jgi:hypothetical protein